MIASDEDLIAEAAEGITIGVLKWSKDEIISFVHKLQNKDLAFIGDKETIEVVKKERKTAEWDLYNRYIRDKNLRILAQAGLALRRLEQRNQVKQLESLRTKISSGFQTKGLHIAEFIQNELLDKFIGTSLPKISATP